MATSICLSWRNFAGKRRRKARGKSRRFSGALRLFNEPQSRFRVELALVKFPAAFQAGDGALDSAHPRKLFPAAFAPVKKPARPLFHRKRKRMAARLVRDAEIAAGFLPFTAVRRDSAP